MSSPKISIIIPVYMAESYLHRCVDSIITQTFTDWELLLVDDGSPDHSGELCEKYASRLQLPNKSFPQTKRRALLPHVNLVCNRREANTLFM